MEIIFRALSGYQGDNKVHATIRQIVNDGLIISALVLKMKKPKEQSII